MAERNTQARRRSKRILVLDVLKPHKPDIVEFGEELFKERSILNINISVVTVDERTETIKVVLEGDDINYENVRNIIEQYGAVIHSVDKVSFGEKGVIQTP